MTSETQPPLEPPPGGPSTRRPRVLLLQKILPHYRVRLFQELSRSERFEFTLGYDPNFVQSSLASVVDPPGIRVAAVRNRRLGRARESDALVWQQGAAGLVRRGDYDAVIAPLTPRIVSNLAVLRAARRRRVAFLWWGHGIGPRHRPRTLQVMVWLARRADAVIFYDRERAQKLIDAGLPTERAFVAPNSIDVEEIIHLRRDVPLAERRSILYVGRLTERKKVDLLIRAFAKARPRLPSGTQLTIIGDGSLRAPLEDLTRSLALSECVRFTGPVFDQPQLAPYFNDAWVSVSPGWLGLSVIHSFAFGLPMIVAESQEHAPEISTVRPGVNGWFFPADDEAALADALVSLRSDGERWRTMSAAAQGTIDRGYGLGPMVARFEEALAFALRSAGRSECSSQC